MPGNSATTTSALSIIKTTTELLSSQLSTNAHVLKAQLTFHKQIYDSLRTLCLRVLGSLKGQGRKGHTNITACNERISAIREQVFDIEECLAVLRGRRAGLWEGVNNCLVKLSNLSEELPWHVTLLNRLFPSRVTRDVQKDGTRNEFRDKTKVLQEVDTEIHGYEQQIESFEMEEACLADSVSDQLEKVNVLVRCVGTFERVLQVLDNVGVDDVVQLVDGLVEENDVLDATLRARVPRGVVVALVAYCERWNVVEQCAEVVVCGVDEVLLEVVSLCRGLDSLYNCELSA